MNAKIDTKRNVLIIELELQTPQPSASGKTMVVGSTRGFAKTTATVNGQPISVSVNATIGNK